MKLFEVNCSYLKLCEVMERRGVTVECSQEIPGQVRDEGDQGSNDGITAGQGRYAYLSPLWYAVASATTISLAEK